MRKKVAAIIKSIRNELSGKDPKYPYVETFTLDKVEFKFWVTDKVYEQWYEPKAQAAWTETYAYLNFIDENDSILEVGCNNGVRTCLCKSLSGKNGLVVGLDIIPENVMIAQAQIGLNNYRECYILNMGADDQARKIRVQNTNNGFVVDGNVIGSIEVDVIPCDDLIPRFGYFSVLKIDVEGYEGNVIRGCKEILSKKPKLLIEFHGKEEIEKYNSSVEEIFNLVNIDQYEGVYCLHSDGKVYDFDLSNFPKEKHLTAFLRPKK
jgi:FkbM family methyltransferase